MSTAVWPPLPPDELRHEEQLSLTRELHWLLDSLRDTLTSLKAGLEECSALLSPDHGASTLALSSKHSESLKGFVVRTGARIVKGDISLKFATLPAPRGSPGHKLAVSTAPQAPTFVLEQLTSVRNLINASLDVIDVSLWTGNAQDADFITGQLRLLYDYISEAKQTLKGSLHTQKLWWENPLDDDIFDPPLPSNLSFHLSISEAALLLQVRVVEGTTANISASSFTGLGVRDRFASALGLATPPVHDEIDQTFQYRGQEVRVKEKIRIESQDPSLMSAMAKLSALEHSVAMSRRALNTVMDKED